MSYMPRNAAERYANRISGGIGLCALCGATVYINHFPSSTPSAGWHIPGHGVDHPSWETIHRELPPHCKGMLLELPALGAGEQ